MGLVHVDAHADTSDVVLGEKIGHGTPFRRCVEEGLLDCKRVVQIGLRGSSYSADSYEWSRAQVLGLPDKVKKTNVTSQIFLHTVVCVLV